jgi:nitrite reductase (NADH) small subunit
LTERRRVGPLADFPEGCCRILEAGGREIGVYNVRGELYAVLNRCPHKLAPICRGHLGGTMLPRSRGEFEYGMDGYVLTCLGHGWEFDIRTGEALFGVARQRLATFPVEVEDGEVYVTLKARSCDAA